MKRKPDAWDAIALAICLLCAVFMAAPLISFFASAFIDAETGKPSLCNFALFFGKKYYSRTLLRSLSVGSCTALLSALLAIPTAYITSTHAIRAHRAVGTAIIISMISPSFIGAYSWVLLLGRSGMLTRLFASRGIALPTVYGFAGIVAVLSLKFYPFIYLYVSGAMQRLDPELLEASRGLGCPPLRNIAAMALPLMLPTVLAGTLLVFMTSFADFGTAMLIGEGYRVMPVLIYREFMGELGGNANLAAAIAVVMVTVTTAAYLLQRKAVDRLSFRSRSVRRPPAKRKAKGVAGILMHAWVYTIAFVGTIPQLTVAYTSFLKTNGPVFAKGYSLDSYRAVLTGMGSAMCNTYGYGLAAVCAIIPLAFAMSYLTVRRRNALTSLLDTCSVFPYVVPGSVLGIMLLLRFNRPPLVLSGTAAIMIISFTIRRLPHALRSGTAILRQIGKSPEEAAQGLGAAPMRAFIDVTSRLMAPGILSGAALSWVAVINELSSSIILYTASTKTMAIAIYSEVTGADYGTAAALSVMLTATAIISLALASSLRRA